jgi:uncharacterized protein
MALTLEEIQESLTQTGLALDVRSKVVKALEEAEAAKKADRGSDSTPKSKNKFVIVVRGDNNLAKELQSGWVVSVAENDDVSTLVERFGKAARAQNDAQKRKKRFIQNWDEFFQSLKRKFSKAENFQPKTKQPVQVIVITRESV